MNPMRRLWHNRLRRDTSLLLAVEIFNRLSGVAILAVLSRSLSSSDIGIYFFALSFAGAFTFLASFRLNPVLVRRVAANPEQTSTYLASLLGFRFVSTPIYLLCVGVAAFMLRQEIWLVVVSVALFTLLEGIYASFSQLFLSLGKTIYIVVIGMVVQVLFLAIFLLGMEWHPALETLLGANLMRALCLAGAAMLVTSRWLCPLRLSWDSSFVKAGIPFTLITLLTMLRGRLGTLLLGFFTDYDTVGHYHLAFRVVSASLFVPAVIGQAFFPQLAAHGLNIENRRFLVRGVGCLLGVGLCGMVGVFLCATPIAKLLYGPQAGMVTPLLRPLTLLFPLSFVQLFLSTSLQALHQETKVLRVLAVGVGINLLANCALIPHFEAYGAVVARLLSTLVQLGFLGWYVWHMFAQTKPLAVEQEQGIPHTQPTTEPE